MDYVKGIHRGFAFVEYESAEDADEAIFNLDGSEMLFGQTISVSVAQPNQIHRLTSSNTGNTNTEAIWTSDEWFQQQISGGDNVASKEDKMKRVLQQEDRKILQNI
jgi:peptidyl-prolyl isomerase E (cyclophilin E)